MIFFMNREAAPPNPQGASRRTGARGREDFYATKTQKGIRQVCRMLGLEIESGYNGSPKSGYHKEFPQYGQFFHSS
jgi:hypothetical protein